MNNDDFERLFLRFRDAGDMRALAKLFDAAAPQLMPVALHLAARRDEADDVIQATFLTAIERADSYERGRPVLPWLLGILALHARKLREKHGRVLDVERVHLPSEIDPERLAAAAEVKHAVDAACRDLPEAYSTIVRRHLVDGLEPVELASELGLSNGAARVRLHRGLKLLRRALPAAFATGAYAATTTARGIGAIRAVVLERASLITGSPVPAAGFAPLAMVLAFLVPLVVAVPAWLVWHAHEAGEVAREALAAMPASEAAAAEPSTNTAAPTSSERVVAPRSAASSSSSGSSFGAVMSNAIVRGRLLWPDGTPASGASVAMSGSRANEERAQEFGMPADWHDPATLHTGTDGAFEFAFDPPRAFQFDLRVERDAAAAARWHWTELAPGSMLDLGDIALEHAASVVVRVVDAQGQPLCNGWSVTAQAPAPTDANGREGSWRNAACSAANGEMLLDELPARAVEVEASCKLGVRLDRQPIELVQSETKHLDIVYTGPDLARRIAITATVTRSFERLDPATTEIRVSKPGMQPRLAVRAPGRASDFVVDDLEPDAYLVEIVDARLVPWSQSNVQPGEVVRAKLSGSAGIRLHLAQSDGTTYTGHYTATLSYLGVNFSPNSFTLLDPSSEPPADSAFTGIVPRDVVLKIAAVGGPSQEIQVLGLAPNEVRDVSCVLVSGIELTGKVLAPDGVTPLAGVDVQLTRGEVAGHTLPPGGYASRNGVQIPRFDQRTTTGAQGSFTFAGLIAGHWTLRAQWGGFLALDATVEVSAGMSPVTLVQPANGSLSGHLVVPAGAPIANSRLVPSMVNGPPFPSNESGLPASAEILADGSFHTGPLPAGEVKLALRVRTPTADGGYMTNGGLQLGPFTVEPAHDTVVELDVSQTFPGRLRAHVTLDGAAAVNGFVECTPVDGPIFGGVGTSVGLDGIAYAGSVPPGLARATFTSPDEKWAWVVPQVIAIQSGPDTPLEIALFTTVRDLRCVDAANNVSLANTNVEWRTGLPGNEVTAHAVTDAQGLLHLKMPEQNVEFRCAGDTGAFTTIAWSAGTGPLTIALHHAP